ncbi:transcriptional regulator, TetR family [Sphingomonas laterariae]|uniref:Transcriptional regulator, TetR family n=1 Tax=Edaphosphingomonas laterariae TaxID=861865 RepID=A0A239BGP1_9SPHN|nr:TetR/AcrR family transcriptional regulator [Sphingomonas laterariae]SNS06254.1 transcriptional regulator, TetR family [Sphingomonas laterariae]
MALPIPASGFDAIPTRDRLLKAAQEEILDAGFFAASTDRIVQRAGASKQTLYSHFPSKERLFQEVLLLTVAEAIGPAPPAVDMLGLEDALRVHARWAEAASSQPANLELYRANIAAATRFPDLAAELHRLRSQPTSLVDLLVREQRDGRLPSIAPERLFSWCGLLAIGGPRQFLGLDPTPAEHQARLNGLLQMFLGGWREPLPEAPALSTPPPQDACPSRAAPPAGKGGRLSPDRWTDMLRCAARRFCEAGFRQTSVEEIAGLSGISKMTIYKHCGNKQGLFAAALDRAVDDLLDQRAPLPDAPDIGAALVEIALEQDRLAQSEAHVQLMRLLVTEAPTQAAIVQRAWLRLIAPPREALAVRLDQWRAQGAIAVPDCMVAAEQFLLLAGRGNRRLTDRIVWDEAEAAQHAREVAAIAYR